MDVDISEVTLPRKYSRLLDLAQVQAQVAQAELLSELLAQLKSQARRPERLLPIGGPR